MSFLDFLKAVGEFVSRTIPYRREEYKYELEIRVSDSPPCYQREVRIRHPWMIWYTRVYGSHVDEAGKQTIWQIK